MSSCPAGRADPSRPFEEAINGDEDERSDWSGSFAPLDDSDAHFGRGFSDSNLDEWTLTSVTSQRVGETFL